MLNDGVNDPAKLALGTFKPILSSFEDTEIQTALNWFRERQDKNGLWKLALLKNKLTMDMQLWITLAICRVFKRFCQRKRI